MGALTYRSFANWAWGGGWLAQLGTNLGLGKGYADFAGSGVVHSVGGLTALAVVLDRGSAPRQVHRDGSANRSSDMTSRGLIGCFILAFGWFGFNPGSTLGASSNAACVSVASPWPRCWPLHGTFGAILYMWITKGKPDSSMSGNASCRPGGDHRRNDSSVRRAPPSLASSPGLVCVSVAFVENVLKVDDPVGAISVHVPTGCLEFCRSAFLPMEPATMVVAGTASQAQ